MMKVLHSKAHEEIVFGLRFVREIGEIREEGSELVLRFGEMSASGVGPVLRGLRDAIESADIKSVYLTDDAISKVVKQYESGRKFESLLLRQICKDCNSISIFDTVTFARAYRYLLESGKMNSRDLERFFAVQNMLASKLSFREYPVSSFEYADLLVGKIVEIKPVNGSDKLYVEKVSACREFQVVSGLRKHYSEEDLLEKKFVFLLNIKPVSLAGMRSEGMILCVSDENGLEAVAVPDNIEAGTRLELVTSAVPVIRTFARPVLDMKKERAKCIIKGLCVKEHHVVFEGQKVVCDGEVVRTGIESGPIS